MSVFRRRRIFRDFGDTQVIGSASVVTASLLTSAIVFAGTALGSTTATSGGSASGAIAFAGGPITEASMEVSCSGPITFLGVSPTGLGISTRNASGTVVFGGIARPEALATGTIQFAGSATVGSTFTMDASGAITFAGTVAGYHLAPQTTGAILFGGTLGTPIVTDGTVEASAVPGSIVFDGTAAGTSANIVQGQIAFGGTAAGERVGSAKPIDRILIAVKPIYDIYIAVKVSGT